MHLPALAISGLLAGRQTFNFEAACSSLASRISQLPNATIQTTGLVQAGTTLSFPNTDFSCGPNTQLVSVDICRISLTVATSASSRIRMEAWLPRNWTGRFLSTGNGGLGGCIQYNDMAYTTSLGFATVGANNGHDGATGAPFLNAPEVVADFAYRSVHTNAVIGKQITELFYGIPHTKSYYLGCSTGGRQGLKSVQDFPEDFEGVVAGAPAVDWNALISWSGHFYSITGPSGSVSFIPTQTWTTTIHQDILSQCDAIDGVKDNVIEDPNLCNYDPSKLLCTGGNTNGCLTQAQVETVRKVFQPFNNSQGNLIYSRPVPGGESLATTMYGGSPFFLTSDWFRYVVYNNPSFNPATLTLADYERAIAMNPSDIATFKGDLSAFQSRNGKLLTYHGGMDGLISPFNTERYYNHVSSTMNLSSSALDSFYRFFRISGMSHCGGGDGASQIGQGAGGSLDPDANVLMAMVRWVEQGVAPDTILGTKYVNDNPTSGVLISRRHCRYPLRNTYRGGDSKQPASWSCQ
ncbi:feruloyl esterase b precursor [Moniliophthora roreri MCA 2997]|uniref:Carboxylic ester hydrolase n=1 Tax=Moniliophthora roreri (strain MCA 2997) TaxID=1381753 RepID=V2YBH9_MONRO|nr:feruloyl esterase b precursor [Moniliophthora roreri MCA 2997]